MVDDKKLPFLTTGWTRQNNEGEKPENSGEASYRFPNMFEESKEMMEASVLIYALADLRDLWRKGNLPAGDQKLLELPVSPGDVMTAVHNNLDALKATYGDSGADFYINSITSIQESLRYQEIDPETGEAMLQSSQLLAFDDEHANTELVYGIAVNAGRKRITVAFRGSVTAQDFITDAQSGIVQIPSPITGSMKTIGVHQGFRDYLHGSKTLMKTGGESKCQKISKELVEIVQRYPGFKVYVTGHSLGGALSTLFALEAAADPRLPKPVSCITIASPKVGGYSFRKAFQTMENNGDLRSLRIANHKDLVTLLPDRGTLSCLYIMCCQSYVYRHVGMELKLYSSSKCALAKASDSDSYFSIFFGDWVRQIKNVFFIIGSVPCVCCCREDFLKYHGCDEYMERILGNENYLKYQNLNELYQKDRELKIYED